MKQKTMVTVMLFFISSALMAQNSHVKLMLGFKNVEEDMLRIEKQIDRIKPVFKDAKLNDLFDQYTIYSIEMAYPASRFPHMHRYYIVECNDALLLNGINTDFAGTIPYAELMPEPQLLYTPNDFGVNCGSGQARDLELIRAKEAWDITHGDPNVVIGVTDQGFNPLINELSGKIDTVRGIVTAYPNHGTIVASIIAAKTDNSAGSAAIGFNCRLDLGIYGAGRYGDAKMLEMSKRGRRVLNASWQYDCNEDNNYSTQRFRVAQWVYNEIYENGTTSCFGAGNGRNVDCWSNGVVYPGSLDHNISVSSVGSMIPYKQKSWWTGLTDSIYWNLKDVHENVVGAFDTIITMHQKECHNHNSRVDIVAPGYTVTGIDANNNIICEGAYGTSFASPLVAGTCGLMLSTQPCLTPYQMEYILKNTAHNIYNIPENMQYIGKLGAGRLDAGAAVSMAHQYDCNSIYTTTMNIKGIEINTKCIPAMALNGIKPQLTPIVENGIGPYIYKWESDPIDNDVILDDYTIENPTVISSIAPHRLHLRLTVYDKSQIQKVASKNIQIDLISTPTYDFAMRDSYMDMMNEPNTQKQLDSREWSIWNSPDIWNRQHKDGIETHENAEYYLSDSNFVYVRVRNVGCVATPATAKLRIYWTKASTGENWDADWTTANYTNTQTARTFPAGREITTIPINIPVLQPGETIVLSHGWRPVKPKDYDSQATSTDVCLLARIEESPTAPFGMTFPEAIPMNVTPIVRNNNNAITKNMSIVDLNPLNKVNGHHVLVANVDRFEEAFDFQLVNEQVINPHFSGDLSQIIEIEIKLGILFDRWVKAGAIGTYTKINTETKSVTFSGNNLIEMKNILLYGEEKVGVLILFRHKENTHSDIPHTIHFRQYKTKDEKKEIYGNITFVISETEAKQNKQQPGIANEILKDDYYSIYPNAASNNIAVQYLGNKGSNIAITIRDISGKVLITNDFKTVSQYQITNFDVSNLTSGVYVINIFDDNGTTHNYKFIKK